MALSSYSVLNILLPPIIIIMQDCSQALNTSNCLSSLCRRGVSNMLLALSITFHCHYKIWGCMCSTGPFQFRWLKGYIYSSWWVQIVGYVLACRSYLFVHYHLIIIIVQTYLKTLNCQIYFVECVSEIKRILSVIHYTIYGAVCFQFTHFPFDDLEDIFTLFTIIIK